MDCAITIMLQRGSTPAPIWMSPRRWMANPAHRIPFNLCDMTDAQAKAFAQAAEQRGIKVQIFGQSADNARAFWNWQFLGDAPDLPRTRAMLMRACDVRLPARLTLAECDVIADVLRDAAQTAARQKAA